MARSVPEWIGKTDDSMPTQKVFLRLYSDQAGICACGCKKVMNLNRDQIVRDHRIPLKDGGANRESNLQLMFAECHRPKTSEENSARAVGDRWKAKAFTELRQRRSNFQSQGFRKAAPQRSATREIIRKSERLAP